MIFVRLTTVQRLAIFCSAICCLSVPDMSAHSAEPIQVDIVVYGGNSAAIIAAVESKRLGRSVVVVCPDTHLGGLSSGGLGWTDTGNKAVIGGLAREFYHRVWKRYQEPGAWKQQMQSDYGNKGQGTAAIDGEQRTMWIFEPHVAEQVFEDLIAEHNIQCLRNEWLDRNNGVTLKDNRIVEIRMLSGLSLRAKMFIDATYEGDLMAAAGVDYHVGRESNQQYGEKWNGIQVGTLHHGHWFKSKIDPYKIPGDPKSGLLPRISSEFPGNKGDGDHRLQAYCYRMCLTQVESNRIPFAKPAGYDPSQYELLLRVFESGWRETFEKYDPIPNLKTDTNNHGPFSTDNIGMNYDYPEATYERRAEILKEHRQYQQGLMYFMANDPRMPADVRTKVATWGLAKDEFTDNDGWPHQIYVREARRMVGKYVMTEHDCLDTRETPDSIGMGSYTLDSHNCQRYVTPEGFVQNEGDIGVSAPRPYEIAYGSIVPQVGQCENLFVPVCLSSSHIAFGSIRMEPVFMILGNSAAAAADIAIDMGVPVQHVPYARLRERLISEGQVLQLEDARKLTMQKLEGTVVDDEAAQFTGDWRSSTANKPFVAYGYRHDGNADKGKLSATFSAKLTPGNYEVRMSFPTNENRATNIPVTIQHAGGQTTAVVNQRKAEQVDKLWIGLGTFEFGETGSVIVSNQGTNGYVILDAIQWLPQTR
jgi:hypothetical protein